MGCRSYSASERDRQGDRTEVDPLDHCICTKLYLYCIALLVRHAFEAKSREFTTRNRLYCHSPHCSAFIGPAASSPSTIDVRICPSCFKFTCDTCKKAWHLGPCSAEKVDADVLALARDNGWQTCTNCQNMVELAVGCFHMTCRCRAQWCYYVSGAL